MGRHLGFALPPRLPLLGREKAQIQRCRLLLLRELRFLNRKEELAVRVSIECQMRATCSTEPLRWKILLSLEFQASLADKERDGVSGAFLASRVPGAGHFFLSQ